MKTWHFALVGAFIGFFPGNLVCQKDTVFWFVAPEVAQNIGGTNFDRPVFFRFSSYQSAATVTLSQPANPAFAPQTISLAPNSSGFFQFNNVDAFENKPPNTVLNYGFLITSTAPITAYYELFGDCMCSPEIFPLKGKNALGTDFYVPFQTYMNNSDIYSPLAHAAFDIVATDDNTVVTINPTQAIAGHPANVPFSITLQKGQTWSGEAAGQAAAQHPSGTRVTSTKPVAITIKDDLLDGSVFGGFCQDIMGDQIIPIEKTGTLYIAQKGFLSGPERIFIVGTAPNTQIGVNGLSVGALGAGQTMAININSGKYIIAASAPVYVLQLTGVGCEVAGKVLPPLDCTGSSSVRFVRPTAEPFWLFLVTEEGNQGGFTLNGNPGLIPASAFSPLWVFWGQYVAAVIPVSATDVVPQASSVVSNSLGLFQMGFLNGEQTNTGARFGFFSDFGKYSTRNISLEICTGDTITFNGIPIAQAGIYRDTIPGVSGCDTLLEIKVTETQFVNVSRQVSFCEGDTLTFNDFLITEAGLYLDTLPGTSGCDTLLLISAAALPYVTKTKTIPLCRGESVTIDGITYSGSVTLVDTLPGGAGCDTIMICSILKSDVAAALGDTIHILYGLSAPLSPEIFSSHGLQTEWTPSINLTFADPLNPVASPPETTEYFLLATDSLGCTATDSVVVAVRVPDCAGSIYIPNVFSPNDDGDNDVFTVFAGAECFVRVKVLRVYDRWGELVFERYDFPANDSYRGWDGTFDKKEAVSGVYVYLVEFENYLGGIEKKVGDVTLVR